MEMITIFSLIVFLFSVVIHEISHGLVAESLGDPTPRASGRITLNPLAHLDPFGSFILPFMTYIITLGQGPIIGYAKPVPVNPIFFRGDWRKGILKVSLAGPFSNIFLGVFFAFLVRIFHFLPLKFLYFFSIISIYNFLLGFFNLLPIFPLDGFHIFQYFLFSGFPGAIDFLARNYFILLIIILFFGFRLIFFLAHFFYHLISGSPLAFY
jgi:Zn-dependent protease